MLIATLLTLGAAACGNDSRSEGQASTPRSSDEQEVRAFVERTGKEFDGGDAVGFCSSLTPRAQRMLVTSVEEFAEGWTGFEPLPEAEDCETVVEIMRPDHVLKDFNPHIVAIEFDGGRAYVTGNVSYEVRHHVAILRRAGSTWKAIRWFQEPTGTGADVAAFPPSN